MSDRDALLRAVCARPDDDTPRLVYADWCDDNGEPEWAEYIRAALVCAAASAADRVTPAARCDALWAAHNARWASAFRVPREAVLVWYRGFPSHADVASASWSATAARALCATCPVNGVYLRDRVPERYPPDTHEWVWWFRGPAGRARVDARLHQHFRDYRTRTRAYVDYRDYTDALCGLARAAAAWGRHLARDA